jgi:signal transduction histidine kinase
VAEALAVLEGQAGHRFRANLAPDLPLVLADPDRLRQVLDNLLSNAVKYSAPDTEIKLGAHLDGQHLRLTVADRGPGISADQLRHLFERFHRVRPDGGPGGSGLGLYISKNLVELMGGQIQASSRPGRGSLFSVTLRLAGAGGS